MIDQVPNRHHHHPEALRESVGHLTRMAIAEDIPDGDITAKTLGLTAGTCEAHLICRQPVIMAGTSWLDVVVSTFGECLGLSVELFNCVGDGDRCPAGSRLLALKGDLSAVVAIERVLLNFLGRALGIATQTRAFVDEVRRHNCPAAILDTRKTLPGYRFFDKDAVLAGGGTNHRMSLSDQVLIKENHVAAFGSVRLAMARALGNAPDDVPVQIEVQDLDQMEAAINAGAKLIMLDNFAPESVFQACDLNAGRAVLEVSGGITLANIGAYCHPRLDRISIGSLTHSVSMPDISLLVSEE